MTIDRVKIGKVRRYFADGVRISADGLEAVIKGAYGEKVCKQIFWDLTQTGSIVIERYTSEANAGLVEQLELANKKIAALEKKVAELTIKNLYADVKEGKHERVGFSGE